MKIGKIDKVELSGLIVLFVGIILLALTFFSAYTFLAGELSILATRDILQAFGEALAPLIEAVIRILYLGIMGWVGSILTIRGVQLLKKERTEAAPSQQQSAKTESKQATKTSENPRLVEKSEGAAAAPSPPAQTPTP